MIGFHWMPFNVTDVLVCAVLFYFVHLFVGVGASGWVEDTADHRSGSIMQGLSCLPTVGLCWVPDLHLWRMLLRFLWVSSLFIINKSNTFINICISYTFISNCLQDSKTVNELAQAVRHNPWHFCSCTSTPSSLDNWCYNYIRARGVISLLPLWHLGLVAQRMVDANHSLRGIKIYGS